MKSSRRAWVAVLLCAGFGAGVSLWNARLAPNHAAYVYLAAFGFIASTVLGALLLLAIMLAIGARWFVVFRGLGEAIASTCVALPLAFVPLGVCLRTVYPETARQLGSSPFAESTREASFLGLGWMSPPLFLLRAGAYFLLWIGFAEALRRASRAQERGLEVQVLRARRPFCAVAVVVLGFSGTWATFDWLMSAIPGWNMTSVGLYVLTGGFTSALGVLTVLVHLAKAQRILPASVGAAHSHALGRLLLAAVCLWAYVAVSQLIIVWSANLPREAAFYLPRATGGYRTLAAGLVFGHFALPFLLLLSRAWKRKSGFVAALGAWLVVMHALDLYWLLAPGGGETISPLDFGPFCCLVALTLGTGMLRFSRRSAVPLRDPDLGRSLGYESS